MFRTRKPSPSDHSSMLSVVKLEEQGCIRNCAQVSATATFGRANAASAHGSHVCASP